MITLTRKAQATWNGNLRQGSGEIGLDRASLELPFSHQTRFGDEPTVSPEDLIGAAHASCFSMALAKTLGDAGHEPEWIKATAEVDLEELPHGHAITHTLLRVRARVPGIAEDEFKRLASEAKTSCPVSKALKGVIIDFHSELES